MGGVRGLDLELDLLCFGWVAGGETHTRTNRASTSASKQARTSASKQADTVRTNTLRTRKSRSPMRQPKSPLGGGGSASGFTRSVLETDCPMMATAPSEFYFGGSGGGGGVIRNGSTLPRRNTGRLYTYTANQSPI